MSDRHQQLPPGQSRASRDRVLAGARELMTLRSNAERIINAELERLRAENERLREALERIAALYGAYDNAVIESKGMSDIARAALSDPVPQEENTDFPPGTVGRTDGLTDDMGG